jgi:hypothetical protein
MKFIKKLIKYQVIFIIFFIISSFLLLNCSKSKSLELSNGTLYYDGKNITIEEATKLRDYINFNSICNIGKNRKTRIEKNNNQYDFYIQELSLIPEELNLLDEVERKKVLDNWNNTDNLKRNFLNISMELSTDIFHNKTVNIHFCDINWKSIVYVKGVILKASKLEYKDGSSLYYSNYISGEDAQSFYKWLGEALGLNKRKTGNPAVFSLHKNNGVYQFRLIIRSGMEKDSKFIDSCKACSKTISDIVFKGSRVDVYLIDENWKSIQIVSGSKI